MTKTSILSRKKVCLRRRTRTPLFLPYSDYFHHSVYVTLDIKRILHEEECCDASEGWKFVNSSEFTEVWRKADPSKPVHLVKVTTLEDDCGVLSCVY